MTSMQCITKMDRGRGVQVMMRRKEGILRLTTMSHSIPFYSILFCNHIVSFCLILSYDLI